eukprot:COSAG01_NODE_29708_length_631_cov_2.629699_1_plen_158_part_01
MKDRGVNVVDRCCCSCRSACPACRARYSRTSTSSYCTAGRTRSTTSSYTVIGAQVDRSSYLYEYSCSTAWLRLGPQQSISSRKSSSCCACFAAVGRPTSMPCHATCHMPRLLHACWPAAAAARSARRCLHRRIHPSPPPLQHSNLLEFGRPDQAHLPL